jgi:hypothetical protein
MAIYVFQECNNPSNTAEFDIDPVVYSGGTPVLFSYSGGGTCWTFTSTTGVGPALSADFGPFSSCTECLNFVAPTQTPTPTPTVTPTEPYDIYQFQDCCNPTNIFRIQNVPGTLIVGQVWDIVNSGFTGCATVVVNTSTGTIYNGGIFTGPQVDCATCITCPSPTPTVTPTVTPTTTSNVTPTPTPTKTPTPTITPSPGSCSSTYCFKTTLTSLSGYSGNYTQGSIYNTKYSYSGNGVSTGVIYYTGNRWCLSTSLGGSCLLEGAYPCYSECPDISANLFTSGPCPTPTPSPVNCDLFDFNAYFDCDWEPIPTPTPSVACDVVDFVITSSLVPPTPTPSVQCNVGVSFSICSYTDTTPTPSVTPTLTLTKTLDVQGQVSFFMLDEPFSCVSVKVLVDCITGDEYYVTDNLIFGGIPVVVGVTMSADINDTNMCVRYDRDDLRSSSNASLTGIRQLYSDCSLCLPASCSTYRIAFNNICNLNVSWTDCDTGVLLTRDSTYFPIYGGGPFVPGINLLLCSLTVPTTDCGKSISLISVDCSIPFVISSTPSPTQTPTPTPTQTPSYTYVYVYESCTNISYPFTKKTQMVQTIKSSITSIVGSTFKDGNGNCWQYNGQFASSYIVPSTFFELTYSGDYFLSSPTTTPYIDCASCLSLLPVSVNVSATAEFCSGAGSIGNLNDTLGVRVDITSSSFTYSPLSVDTTFTVEVYYLPFGSTCNLSDVKDGTNFETFTVVVPAGSVIGQVDPCGLDSILIPGRHVICGACITSVTGNAVDTITIINPLGC